MFSKEFVRSSKSWELKHLVIGHVDLWEMIKLYDYVVANNIEDIFLIFHWRYFALIAVTFNVIVVYFYIYVAGKREGKSRGKVE